MLSPILPTGANFLYTVLEPISLLGGFIGATFTAPYFLTETLPVSSTQAHAPAALLVSQQLGSAFFLLGLIGLGVLGISTEPRVVHAYLVALAIGDVGHVFLTCLALGQDALMRPRNWNALTWGSVGFTCFLFVTRLAYFAGLFGRDRVPLRKKPSINGAENSLAGLSIAFTGRSRFLDREQGESLVKQYGGKIRTVGPKTDYVVVGSDAGKLKLRQIDEFKLKAIDEDGLFRLIAKRKPAQSAEKSE